MCRRGLLLLVLALPLGDPLAAEQRGRERAFIPLGADREAYARLAGEVEEALRQDVAGAWFPRSLDANGGFHETFAFDWSRGEDEGRSTVFQARMTWIAAQLAIRRPELRDEYLPYVRRGVAVLDETLWDREKGGFYWNVGNDGSPGAPADSKHIYAQAFGIFAAAAAWEATGDERALELARRSWRWIESHAHDDVNGGYHEMLRRDGTPIPLPATITPELQRYRTFYAGFKSSNAHIHLLEAHTQLYRVWKDPAVRVRLEELLTVVRDRLTVAPGCLYEMTHSDWRPLPAQVNWGHGVEAGFFLLDAADALGMPNDPRTRQVARMLVDHTLSFAFNSRRGGVTGSGGPLQPGRRVEGEWWVQVEALNAFSLMHSIYGSETDRYWTALQLQWHFIRTSLLDPVHHGVFEEGASDGRPRRTPKGHPWKAAYHDGRAFLLTADRLRALAASRNQEIAAPQPADHQPR